MAYLTFSFFVRQSLALFTVFRSIALSKRGNMKGRHLVSDILATILICQCVFQIENEKPGITERVIRKILRQRYSMNISELILLSLEKIASVQENLQQFSKTNNLCNKMMLMVPEM